MFLVAELGYSGCVPSYSSSLEERHSENGLVDISLLLQFLTGYQAVGIRMANSFSLSPDYSAEGCNGLRLYLVIQCHQLDLGLLPIRRMILLSISTSHFEVSFIAVLASSASAPAGCLILLHWVLYINRCLQPPIFYQLLSQPYINIISKFCEKVKFSFSYYCLCYVGNI